MIVELGAQLALIGLVLVGGDAPKLGAGGLEAELAPSCGRGRVASPEIPRR